MTWVVRNGIRTVFVSVAALLATPAYGFDGKWPGFLMGASVGVGVTSGVIEEGADRDTSFAGSTGIRLGYGFGNYAVFLMTHMTWSSYETGAYGNYNGYSTRGDHGFYGLSVAYRTKSQRPFLYPIAGVGVTTWRDPPVHPESIIYSSWGLLAGAGMEPWKHVSFELFGYMGFGAEGNYAATQAWSIQLAATFTAY